MSVQLDPYETAVEEGKTTSVEIIRENGMIIVRKITDYTFSAKDERFAEMWYEECQEMIDEDE